MANLRHISGLNQVLANTKKATALIRAGERRGLLRAGFFLQRKSQDIVPWDEGNLHSTAFTRPEMTALGDSVIVGYTAEYAVYVHEDMEKAHGEAYNKKYAMKIVAGIKGYHTRGENQQAKFLEKPARENRTEMLAMIAKETAR